MRPGDLGPSVASLHLNAQEVQTTSDDAHNPLHDSKRRHYLKKLLLTKIIDEEIASLNETGPLENFGSPFRQTSATVIDGTNTSLPILRFVFLKFVCTFPFLLKTDQEVFWRDKVQVFFQAFASRRISSSEDRAESSKRAKLAARIKSMLVLLMNSGLHAGQEESITVDEAERRSAESVKNLDINVTEGHFINGFDVNVAGVRTMQKSHKMRRREHHSEFLVRTKRKGMGDIDVARRYGAFKKLHTNLREEFPGKQIPRLPMKNKAPATASSYIPSMPTFGFGAARTSMDEDSGESADDEIAATKATGDSITESVRIPREKQRLTLRSFLRRLLQDPQIAQSTSLRHFLLDGRIKLTEEEDNDCRNRRDLDSLRHDEQLKFLEVARERAKELDAQMDIFKRQLIQESGLSKIFGAIRECDRVEDLPEQYIKVIEWGRIEVAATLYQLFVADDNSSEMFAQAKRVHSLFPYSMLKNIIRFSNPMTMMRAGIDLFLATPFGRASLFQRMFSSTLNEEIKEITSSIEALRLKIDDNGLCDKLKAFVHAREDQQAVIRLVAQEDDVDLIVSLMRNEDVDVGPKLNGQQISKVFLANAAWVSALEGNTEYSLKDAQMYGYFSQLLKLYTRQRDKEQMTELLFDGATSNLLKDIVGIFYEPLARVYKAASIHNSIMDFSKFVDDTIQTVNKAEEQDLSTNPNALVQTFIDLTGRHQNSFFHFVHEAHVHDDGLFDGLMSWVELILTFLREGAAKHLDLEKMIVECPNLDQDLAISEIDACIRWNGKMKIWRQERLRKRMAADQDTVNESPSTALSALSGADFGLDQNDLDELLYEESDGDEELEEEIDDFDPLEAEMRRKKKAAGRLSRRYGEPEMPVVREVYKLTGMFGDAVRDVLAQMT
ncbi:PX domain protein [Taphrina deformans PYCC 5710]|uniref:PX domain protein n=1 Tax=Taphrina deformans (strain PYCC 5710 / ATCC 11124 / CBS 356.35 / IMI 108563 / JCM 9778 / NBRC 8474) TaxID=1097556 RepID=R4XDV7_TAPDE|nr:PX domain protein [Taphrina deformans PYCC 5710]|eukprot:CCG81519.1 PX domain protein [Taphrina deformans PYCC 5710]